VQKPCPKLSNQITRPQSIYQVPSSEPKVSVVICALNEEHNLSYVLPKIPSCVHEVVLVDGHSTDQTIEVAKKLRPDIKIYIQPGRGKGAALKYGISVSEGEIVVTLDADGTYLPEEIPKFVSAILQGNDFAKGTRFLGGRLDCMSVNRQFGNKVLALTANLLLNIHYTDICSGFYAFSKTAFQNINLVSDGFEMEQELFIKIAKMKLKVIEVPHGYKVRMFGNSKTKDFRQGIKNLLWIFSLCLSPLPN